MSHARRGSRYLRGALCVHKQLRMCGGTHWRLGSPPEVGRGAERLVGFSLTVLQVQLGG